MYDNKVKSNIENLFCEVKEKVQEIIMNADDTSSATHSIVEYVSSKITAASRGYMTDVYTSLSKATLNEAIFNDSANANKFYELNLRQKIYDAYQFDINDLSSYKSGIDFKEVNRTYATAGATIGTLTLGGILKATLTKVIDIPLIVIIAGAVILGWGTYVKGVPEYNKMKYIVTVNTFIADLENEFLVWVDVVEEFFNQQVSDLKKTL